MKKLCVVFILIFINSKSLYSTEVISKKEMLQLDSLILDDQYEEVISYLDNKKSFDTELSFTKSEKDDLKFITNSYILNLRKIKVLHKKSSEENNQTKNIIKNSNQYFSSELAGIKGEEYYNLSIEHLNTNTILALKYYYLAEIYKRNYVYLTKKTILPKFKIAKELYHKEKYHQAYEILNKLTVFINEYPIDHNNQINIKKYLLDTKKKLSSKRINEKLFDQNDEIYHKWLIFISFHQLIYDKDNKNVTWELKPKYSSSFSSVSKKVETQNAIFFSANIFHGFSPKIQAAIGFEIGQYKRNYVSNTDWKIEHIVDAQIINANIKYLLKTKAGLRPFIIGGMAYAKIERESFSTSASLLVPFSSLKVDVVNESISLSQINAAFGLEYIPNTNSKIIYNVSLPINYYLKENNIIGQYNFGYCIRIGYIIS